MPNYTITIKNNSSQSQSFVLFQDLPKPASIPRDNVFTNVYQRAARVSNSAQARFKISSDLHALYGASHRTDDGMVRVETSEYRPARLGPQGSRFYLSTENSGGHFPKFGNEDDSVQAGGAFTVSSDNTFDVRNPEKMYFGVGAIAPDEGDVVPVYIPMCLLARLSTLLLETSKRLTCPGAFGYCRGLIVAV